MILDQWQQVCDAQADSGGAAGVSLPDLPGPGVLPLLLPGAPPSHIQARLPRNIKQKKNYNDHCLCKSIRLYALNQFTFWGRIL